MAYENGYEVVDYIGGCIERYRNDSLIFYKASSIVNNFVLRSDWPYCVDELDKATSIILGEPVTILVAEFAQKYFHDPKMIWPENLPDNFRRDFEAFYVSLAPTIEQAWNSKYNPLRFHSLAITQTFSREEIFRFIRADGKYFDILMDCTERDNLIKVLSEYKFY